MEMPEQEIERAEQDAILETAESSAVLERFDTDNPYLQRLFAHESFGVVPNGCGALLEEIETRAPDEQLVSAMKVRHGMAEGGVLMVTTHWLRYVKQGRLFTVIDNDEFWPLDGGLELEANLGGRPLFRTPDGHQFQVFPTIPIVSRRQAKGFLAIYKLTALASVHLQGQIEDAALAGMAAADGAGTAAEIKELVALRDSGALSESEFEAAKARLLEA
jgi:Short C-terminal domain